MVIRGEGILDRQNIPSGNGKLSISIGGIRCAIFSHDTGFLDFLRARYRWFESSGPAAYEILVRLLPVEELNKEKISCSLHPLIKKVNSGDNYIIRQTEKPFVAVANTFSRKVLIKMNQSEDSFDSFLRLLFAMILSGEKGLLLHASAVSEKGRGSVFLRASGCNKTAIGQLADGRTILSNEVVVIRPHNGGYRVYGTPFGAEFLPAPSNARAELNGLYLLKEAQENRVVLMDKAQALAYLYQCVPFFNGDSRIQSRILEACRALIDLVPVYELHFLPDASFWPMLSEWIVKESEQLFSGARLKQAAQRGEKI
jgi:hypothetical protein